MRLLFAGDSLIEYGDWQERFPGHEVYQYGIAGETVEGLLSRLQTVMKDVVDADGVFLMTGINNLAMDDRGFVVAYRKILAAFKARYPSARIFVNSLLPVRYPFISNEEIRRVNRELRALADTEGVDYLEVHVRFLNHEGDPKSSYFLEDGVHLSPEGYRVWASAVEERIS